MNKALVIESNSLIGETLKQQLRDCGYDTIISADTGEEGILLALTEKPKLILIDIDDLVEMSGWQVIDILMRSTITQKVPIIALMTPVPNAGKVILPVINCNNYLVGSTMSCRPLLAQIEALLQDCIACEQSLVAVPQEAVM